MGVVSFSSCSKEKENDIKTGLKINEKGELVIDKDQMRKFAASLNSTKASAVLRDFSTFDNALEAYYLYNDTYPLTEEGLKKLVEAALLKNKKNTFWSLRFTL